MVFSWIDFQKPIIIAHRGAPALGPENTAVGFSAALMAGADALETDIRQTKDGKLVCFHDSDLMRLRGSSLRIDEIVYDHLKDIYPSILDVQEALEAKGNAGLLLDLKIRDPHSALALCVAVRSVTDKSSLLFGPRNFLLARELKKLMPDCAILGFTDSPDHIDEWANNGADWLRLWEADFTPEYIEHARSRKMKIAVMTGDWRPKDQRARILRDLGSIDQPALTSLLRLGPDAVLLDDPRLMTVNK
jgi:glycerophosphoryl diester phosphodiesterase